MLAAQTGVDWVDKMFEKHNTCFTNILSTQAMSSAQMTEVLFERIIPIGHASALFILLEIGTSRLK